MCRERESWRDQRRRNNRTRTRVQRDADRATDPREVDHAIYQWRGIVGEAAPYAVGQSGKGR